MTALKKITKTTHYVDIYDLCTFLSEKAGIEVQFGETRNDTDYSVSVQKGEIPDFDKAAINEFLVHGYLNMYYGWTIVLTYAANQGWLEEGDYVFRVSW